MVSVALMLIRWITLLVIHIVWDYPTALIGGNHKFNLNSNDVFYYTKIK